MPVVVVANPKGGVGKSTLSTHIAGYWASQGHAVTLGDVDRQQSSRMWLDLRPDTAREITTWDVQRDFIVRPPRGATHVVVDTPAGLDGMRLRDLVRLADGVVVPLQPGIFDMHATRAFIDLLQEVTGRRELKVGLVGTRASDRMLATRELRRFMEELGLPVLGMLRTTQNYVHLAASGMTIFDVAPGRVQRDLEQWQDLCRWLDSLSD